MDIRRKSSLYLPLGSVNLVLKAMGIPDEISSPPGWNRVSPGCPRNFNTKLTEPTRQINTTFPMNMIHPFICILLTHLFTLVTWWSMYTFLIHRHIQNDMKIWDKTHSFIHSSVFCDVVIRICVTWWFMNTFLLRTCHIDWLTHSPAW